MRFSVPSLVVVLQKSYKEELQTSLSRKEVLEKQEEDIKVYETERKRLLNEVIELKVGRPTNALLFCELRFL